MESWIKPQFRCPSEVLPSVTWVGLFSQLKGVCVRVHVYSQRTTFGIFLPCCLVLHTPSQLACTFPEIPPVSHVPTRELRLK